MHDLSDTLQALQPGEGRAAAHQQAMRLERGEVFSVRRELLFGLYIGVAALVAGVGLLVKANLDRIGPVALLTGILAAALLCYAVAWRARRAGRERSLGEDYILLLGALLFSSAVAYAEVQFRLFGDGWSRHVLLLSGWHLLGAYYFGSRLVLTVALTAFAGWLGVEMRLGTLLDPWHPLLGAGPRLLLCAVLYYAGSHLHRHESRAGSSGFRDVYLQFAVNFAFWAALALGGDSATRWVGALLLIVLAVLVGRAGLVGRRQSFLLYAVGYTAIGMVWLQSLLVRNGELQSWLGLFTVIGAIALLMNLRARLRESVA